MDQVTLVVGLALLGIVAWTVLFATRPKKKDNDK